jgi:hypothetical protein
MRFDVQMKFLECILSGTPYTTAASHSDKTAHGERRPLGGFFGSYWIIAPANQVDIVVDKRSIRDSLIFGRPNGYSEIAFAVRYGLGNVLRKTFGNFKLDIGVSLGKTSDNRWEH